MKPTDEQAPADALKVVTQVASTVPLDMANNEMLRQALKSLGRALAELESLKNPPPEEPAE